MCAGAVRNNNNEVCNRVFEGGDGVCKTADSCYKRVMELEAMTGSDDLYNLNQGKKLIHGSPASNFNYHFHGSCVD